MRIFALAFCLSGIITSVFGESPQTPPEKKINRDSDHFGVEARVSGQFFITSLLKEMYGSGVNYEILGTYKIEKGIGVWAAVDYFYKKGYTATTHIASRMTLVPLTIGVRYTYSSKYLSPYIGAGLKYSFIHFHNYSSLVVKEVSKNAPGFVGEVGCQYRFWKGLFLDSFFSYSYVHFSKLNKSTRCTIPTDLTLQNWNVGGGLGYEF